MTTKTITMIATDDISLVLQNSSDLTQLDRDTALLLRTAWSEQGILIKYWSSEYEIGIVDSEGKHVAAPGFKVPDSPEARIHWNSHNEIERSDTNPADLVTLIPAAISWIGYGGYYQSQAAPGMVALAAETAEAIAAIVSDPEGLRAQSVMEDAIDTINDMRERSAREDAARQEATDAIIAYAQINGGADIDPDTVKVCVMYGESNSRTAPDSYTATLRRVMDGHAGLLCSDKLTVEVQMKPRGRWHRIMDRQAGYSYA